MAFTRLSKLVKLDGKDTLIGGPRQMLILFPEVGWSATRLTCADDNILFKTIAHQLDKETEETEEKNESHHL